MKTRRNLRWQEMNKSNIELSHLMECYKTFNQSEGKSPRTIEWYEHVLQLFQDWLQSTGKPTNLGSLGEPEVRDFILALRQKQVKGKVLSTHTINNRVRALRAFFSWLARDEYTSDNLLAKMKPPKVAETIVEPLNPEEIEKLFSVINQSTMMGARNAAILATFLDTGLRVSEITQLKTLDVHLDQKYIKVFGKGSKERMVPIGISCHKTLMRYNYQFRPEPAHAGIEVFFLTLDGYELTASAVKSLMVRISQVSGIKRLHPHLLRHTYATSFLLNGGDVFLLKQNLGHSTLKMVEHYRHIASRQAAILSQSFSPLDRMNLSELRRNQTKNNGSKSFVYQNAGKHRH